ncbi:MAG: hypothetical protein MOB07_23185 [Acidobacteria bacterium]|nr:hypothetical protein [Acidobacteriota bacterium]
MPRAYEIFPESIVLYPSDKILFSIRGTAPPVFWESVTDASIEADYTLKVVGTPVDLRGGISYLLRAGVGRVKFTLTPNCLPTTGGFFDFYINTLSTITTYRMEVKVNPTNVTIFDIVGLIHTHSVTPVVGDVWEIELAGNNFRAYKNGVLIHGYTFAAGNIATGARSSATLDLPVNTSPATIPQPELIGIWEAYTVEWIYTNSGGTGTATFSFPITYTAGVLPGLYTLQARPDFLSGVTGANLETVSAQITIPPLTVLGALSLTVNPSEKVRILTNYDAAQTKLVTWAVASGSGSFDGANVYTAGSAMGTSVVRASSGLQRADVSVTVRATITKTPDLIAVEPSEAVAFTTNIGGSINWAADHGTASGSGATFNWTAPAYSDVVAKVTADNGTTKVTIELPVLKKFPFGNANLPLNWERKKTVLISRAEDRSRTSRVKDKFNLPFESYELSFKQRTDTELATTHAFWDEHHPGKRFIYVEQLINKRHIFYFDSDIRHEGNTRCGIDYSFRVIDG